MPHKRPPMEVWENIRFIIWARDKRRCKRCHIPVSLEECHIDHIVSGKLGNNKFKNLRCLCRRCHTLRADMRHRGMMASGLRDGVIDADWKENIWEG